MRARCRGEGKTDRPIPGFCSSSRSPHQGHLDLLGVLPYGLLDRKSRHRHRHLLLLRQNRSRRENQSTRVCWRCLRSGRSCRGSPSAPGSRELLHVGREGRWDASLSLEEGRTAFGVGGGGSGVMASLPSGAQTTGPAGWRMFRSRGRVGEVEGAD